MADYLGLKPPPQFRHAAIQRNKKEEDTDILLQ